MIVKIFDRGMQYEDKKLDFIPMTIRGLEWVKWGSVDGNVF